MACPADNGRSGCRPASRIGADDARARLRCARLYIAPAPAAALPTEACVIEVEPLLARADPAGAEDRHAGGRPVPDHARLAGVLIDILSSARRPH